MLNNLELSDYVTLIVFVPETHADKIREAMAEVGAGEFDNYKFCSFSTKGIGRFMPSQNTEPYIGTQGVLESVIEEKIETICSVRYLEKVLKVIKLAHPYESTIIKIYPIYQMGCKFS